jgi:hypothetical protein
LSNALQSADRLQNFYASALISGERCARANAFRRAFQRNRRELAIQS